MGKWGRGACVGILVLGMARPARGDDAPAPANAPASADVDPKIEEARERHRRGLELYDEGDFRLALVEFERAYELSGSYKLLFNIGQVHFQLMHYAKARLAFERYLHDGGEAIPERRKQDVERDLATLRKRTATLSVRVNVPDAEVAIDGVPVGKAPIDGLVVDAGNLRVEVTSPAHPARSVQLTLAGGDARELPVQLGEEVARAPAPAAPSAPAAEPAPAITRATIGWIATGALAAGAIATGVGAVISSSRYEDDLRAPIQGSPEDAARSLSDQRSTVRTLAIATDVLAVGALAVGGAALYFTLHDRRHRSERRAARVDLGLGPGAVLVGGRF